VSCASGSRRPLARSAAGPARTPARGAGWPRAQAASSLGRACGGPPRPVSRRARVSRRGRLHALRKDSKVLLHELEEAGPRAGAVPGLRRLTKVLGEERDLSLLRERLGRGDGTLSRLASRRRRRLRRRALLLAGEIYSGGGRNVAIIGERS
jgi:hypothetical protein